MNWIDRWRVFPRIVLIGYMLALYLTLNWYLALEPRYQTSCDSNTLKVLLDKGASIEQAREVACTVVDVVAQPNGYTALISVLVGASAAIFSFYVNSGPARKDP